MTVWIHRSGTLIELSHEDRTPLSQHLVDVLKPRLSYEHKTLLRGHQRFTPGGQVRNIDIEVRRMYALEQGRLVTGFGFLTTICEILQQHQEPVRYVDLSPERLRPDCYEEDWDNVYRHIEFRPLQEDCLRMISRNELGVINAPTGFGKSHLFEAIALLYPKAKIDIVVKPKDVAARIVRQLTRVFPNVGQVGGGKSWKGDRITVYTAASLHKADGDCDIVLADEVHLLMAKRASQELGRAYRFCRLFGFTATPEGRMDGLDVQLEMYFGRQIFRLSYPDAVRHGLVAPIKVRWLPIRLTYNPAQGKTDVPRMRWGVWRNVERNRIIAEDVRANYGDPDTQVLILVATIDHAVHLWQHLPEFALCYSEMDPHELEKYKRNNMLPPGARLVTAEVREELRRDFESRRIKKVIATDVWATGVDFASLQVLYRADARESEIMDTQAPGRVSRVHDGKEYGIIVDCYDAFDRTLRRKSEKRKSHYRKLGWEQEEQNRRISDV